MPHGSDQTALAKSAPPFAPRLLQKRDSARRVHLRVRRPDLVLRLLLNAARGDGAHDRGDKGRVLCEGARPRLPLDVSGIDAVRGLRRVVQDVCEVEQHRDHAPVAHR